MSKIKKILVSSVIALIVIAIAAFVIKLIDNKNVILVPVATSNIEEGSKLSDVAYVQVKLKNIAKDVLENMVKEQDLFKYVAKNSIQKGETLIKDKVILKEEYLEKTENLEYVSLPIKGATEGVAYKLSVGDKINVYYTAKRKSVEGILKSKLKVYSSTKEESMVTCLLYQNVEVVMVTNNLGVEVTDGSATNILVRLKSEEVLELANLKEQGVFTYSLI